MLVKNEKHPSGNRNITKTTVLFGISGMRGRSVSLSPSFGKFFEFEGYFC
jgi:hypothetical protein